MACQTKIGQNDKIKAHLDIFCSFDYLDNTASLNHRHLQMNSKSTSSKLALYYQTYCPYCVKTVNVIQALELDIELRETSKVKQFKNELRDGGGKTQVPCLQITDADGDITWMYESSDIIEYIKHQA